MDNQGRRGLSSSAGDAWLLFAFVPVMAVLVAFILGGWSWGLMDDYGWVTMPGTIWERISGSYIGLFASGRFQPVYPFHAGVFYKVFSSSPTAFYIFRWVECVLALGVWAFLAWRVTRSHFAAPLFLFIALSFYKIYDGFFYLSTLEILGVLFFGFSVLFFLNAIESRVEAGGKLRWGAFAAGTIFLALAFLSKETFLVTSAALGAGSVIVSLGDRKKGVLWFGIAGLFLAVAYAVFLKTFIMKGYSAAYAMTDPGIIGQNILLWAKKDLPFHAPWLLLTAVLLVAQKGRAFSSWPRIRSWAFLTGAAAYVGYVLIILPWSTWGHYVTPLAVFFAFPVAVLLADRVEALRLPSFAALATVSFVFTLIVGAMALKFHSTYQYDSANLLKWLATNALFEHEMDMGAVVRGNATEPCQTIVSQVNGIYGKSYKAFIFTPGVRDILADPATRYYLWGPKWGDQDLSRLGKIWSPMFVSENWVLFRRMN